MRRTSNASADRFRYGIGEWYGLSFVKMTSGQRQGLARMQIGPKKDRNTMPCIPRGGGVPCSKEGGVCSIRVYQQTQAGGAATAAPGELGRLVTTCPCRFDQEGLVTSWVGEEILGCAEPLIVSEVGFLEREAADPTSAAPEPGREDVGRIDRVAVHPALDPMIWCAVEMQAVYFSGPSMSHEFAALADHTLDSIPFPSRLRRPDYRSSGPKRLMPQLQIKVPTLRRWGKKMAVVVDESFYSALGVMDSVNHMSNADIAWFVVSYDESGGEARIARGQVVPTTLERAVEGLTAGRPVSLAAFESRIREKLSRAR